MHDPDLDPPGTAAGEGRWAHQPAAVAAITEHLRGGGRATLQAACGSGKSRIAALAARNLVPDGPVLVAVPTLDLTEQMLAAFRDAGDTGRQQIAVCCDEEIMAASGRTGTVTTRPAELAAAVGADPGRTTVVCTYASLPVVAAAHAHHHLGAWGLAIADEAHRTAGRQDRAWSLIHDDVVLPARRRLYMTATRRILTGDTVVSMDDEKTYGPVVFRLTTVQAVARGLLADWKLLVAVADPELDLAAMPHLKVGRAALAPEVAAQQVAVLRAASDHGLTAMITYHHRVQAARSWAITLPQTWQHMPEHLRPPAVKAQHVHGGQDPRLRRAVLASLRTARPGAGLSVVTNARVLTEGVDIPSVDGVALVDPRSSAIDIVQIIGRALRIGDRRAKTATIIVPLLLSPGQDPEQALQSSTFSHLWQVLKGLRAHDERLENHLDAARADQGARSFTGTETDQTARLAPDWLSVTGTDLPAGFAEQVWVTAVAQAAPTWMQYYGAARAFKDAHGHIDIFSSHRTPDGLPLGRWWWAQHHRSAALTLRQRDLLHELGSYTNQHDRVWETGLAAARAWIDTHPGGLHNIPATCRALKSFLTVQRSLRRSGRLAPDRDTELTALDPTWHLTRPEMMLRAARAFVREHGHLLPDPDYRTGPGGNVPAGLDLPAWLDDCRLRASQGALNPRTHNALKRLGMIWNRRDAKLARGVHAARAHARIHRGLPKQADHVCRNGYELGRFMVQQRGNRRQGKQRPWVRAALDALDTTWFTTKADNRAHKLGLAAAYAAEHGRLPRPKGPGYTSPAPTGEDFRHWLTQQRLNARKGNIHPDVLAALNNLDPGWLTPPSQSPNRR